MYSGGDDSSIARIENVEFKRMGQAFKVDRYAIHLRVVGKMSESYIKSNSIRHSYNRAISIHGT
jgi:hypothetical protein